MLAPSVEQEWGAPPASMWGVPPWPMDSEPGALTPPPGVQNRGNLSRVLTAHEAINASWIKYTNTLQAV